MVATLLARLNRMRFDGKARRLAAITCLLLAVLSALSSRTHSHAATIIRPGAGQVAVQVTLSDGGAGRSVLHPGDRVDLVTDSAAVRLADVEVLQVMADQQASVGMLAPETTAGGTSLVVALRPTQVGAIATLATRRVFAAPASTS